MTAKLDPSQRGKLGQEHGTFHTAKLKARIGLTYSMRIFIRKVGASVEPRVEGARGGEEERVGQTEEIKERRRDEKEGGEKGAEEEGEEEGEAKGVTLNFKRWKENRALDTTTQVQKLCCIESCSRPQKKHCLTLSALTCC